MNGGIYTYGPLYRPDPGAPIRDYRPPAMPPRYQPRHIQREQIGLKPIPEHAEIVEQQAQPAAKAKNIEAPVARFHSARGHRKRDPAWDKHLGASIKPPLTPRIIKRIKDANGYLSVSQIIAIAPERLDVKSVANLLHRYKANDQIVTRRSEDGSQLEYCWGATARTGEQRVQQAKGRSLSAGSLTFWVCSALREDRERWMSTEEMAAFIASAAPSIEGATPAVISTRLSPLLRSGRLEKRPREGAKHGHGSTMEYRLTTAF